MSESSGIFRRSQRRLHCTVKEEEDGKLIKKIESVCQDGLSIHDFSGKGRGVVAEKNFSHGEFVIEYRGELITIEEAKIREAKYASQNISDSYMYYFKNKGVRLCIDATIESSDMGRLINHSRTKANLTTRIILVHGTPRLVFFAKGHIKKNSELLYDYGDRRKQAQQFHPWLKC